MSVDYLRDETVINGNVDGEVLEPFIIVAQNLHIEQITGTNLYNKLIADITAGSVTGVYKTLLDDYIQPALLQWSLFECLPFINYNFTNKSISTQDSDNSTAVSLEDVKYLRANIKDVAEYYSTRAIAYLKDNEDSFVIRIGSPDGESDGIIYIGEKTKNKPRKYDLRTTEDVVFAFGFNNAIIDGVSLDDSPYKIGGSGFMELGYAWKTRLFDNTNFWRLK